MGDEEARNPEKMKVAELKEELKRRNLPVTGTKPELVKRLAKIYDAELDGPTVEMVNPPNIFGNVESASPKAGRKHLLPADEEMAVARANLTLFRSPVATLRFFFTAVLRYGANSLAYVREHPFTVPVAALLMIALGLRVIPGPHQSVVQSVEYLLWYAGFWITLGIMSSVGLGTGLHTFVLYLGPLIAEATMAASTCKSTEFDLMGENAFICPPAGSKSIVEEVTFWMVLRKVQLTAMLWGLGTAIGELPPYFFAKAARDSSDALDEELESDDSGTIGRVVGRMKHYLFDALQKYGFWAILAAASIPNPLFDLAGITCGHFGVPFMTFFGATVLGKAVVKTHIQTFSVILISQPAAIAVLIELISWFDTIVIIPLQAFLPTMNSGLTFGCLLGLAIGFLISRLLDLSVRQRAAVAGTLALILGVLCAWRRPQPIAPFLEEWIAKQQASFKSGHHDTGNKPIVARIWELVIFGFLAVFGASIVSSIAQGELKSADRITIKRLAGKKVAE